MEKLNQLIDATIYHLSSFHLQIVTFNGTSNLTADNVFKTVTYKEEVRKLSFLFFRIFSSV